MRQVPNLQVIFLLVLKIRQFRLDILHECEANYVFQYRGKTSLSIFHKTLRLSALVPFSHYGQEHDQPVYHSTVFSNVPSFSIFSLAQILSKVYPNLKLAISLLRGVGVLQAFMAIPANKQLYSSAEHPRFDVICSQDVARRAHL